MNKVVRVELKQDPENEKLPVRILVHSGDEVVEEVTVEVSRIMGPYGTNINICLRKRTEEKTVSFTFLASPPSMPVKLHECGFCHSQYPTVHELYQHQRDRHDPDGIMFSELGLPK